MKISVSRLPLSFSRQRGFTLIEVMIALVIVAISLTGMAVTMGSMLDNATTLRERTYASWIAQNKIVEVRLTNEVPNVGSTSGDIEFANSTWEWRADIAETGVENLLRIDVAVSWPGAEQPIRTVTGFIGEPIIPGLSNQVWGQLSYRSDDEDDPGGQLGATE